jgi:hypothetical protein
MTAWWWFVWHRVRGHTVRRVPGRWVEPENPAAVYMWRALPPRGVVCWTCLSCRHGSAWVQTCDFCEPERPWWETLDNECECAAARPAR